jgi:hypothetical protein
MRHCERSAVVHASASGEVDCFVAIAPRNDAAAVRANPHPEVPRSGVTKDEARLPTQTAGLKMGCVLLYPPNDLDELLTLKDVDEIRC